MPSQRASAQRRTTSSQIDHVYDPGKVGRKTGVTLQERDRDEQGFEDMDIFSSPEKDIHGNAIYPPSEDEQDMEIDDESQMGPATMMKQRQERERLSLPRARSPIKTSLKSPARQNPHMPPTSSPTRGSIVTSREHSPPRMVSRRLDFSKSAQTQMKPVTNGQRKLNGTKPRNGKITNGRSHTEDEDSDDESIPNRKPGRQSEEQEDDEEDEDEVDQMQALDHDSGDGDLPEQEPEPEPEPEEDDESVVQQLKPTPKPKAGKPKTGKPKGRPKKATPPPQEESEASVESVPTPVEEVEEAEEEPVKKKRGRPKAGQSPTEAEPSAKASKRRKQPDNSIEESEEQENVAETRETKRPRTEKKEIKSKVSKPTAAKEKGKPGRKRKSSGIGVDSPVVQRGPPLPKSRGLVTLRREEQDGMRTTRSGRASYRPLEFWKGERVEYDTAKAEVFEDKGRHFAMPTIKGIVRAEEIESEKVPRRRRGRPAARGGPRRSASIIEEEVEREDWELDGGHIVGDCVLWRPEYQFDPPAEDGGVEIQETELAISDAAIEARPVKDSTFLFAKTLTMPFFGSGIVEMPPGSEKRHKNTRKMHMVFFVHTGSVTVNIADNEFQIGKGGTWFVPRGNFYGIRNETNKTSRIFFAQGCETLVQAEVLEQE